MKPNEPGIYTSVLDFGARGDGVADDTDAIQGAIDRVYRMQYGVYDPDDRMHAKITFHSGYPVATAPFSIHGDAHAIAEQFM